jgi:hypothetical protein
MSEGPPEPTTPDPNWEHFTLWEAVRSSLFALPSRFESDLVISGVLAPDLFSFNSSLAAMIEEQVVAALNRLRETWDPKNSYALYQFERQPQTFPDVILKAQDPNLKPQILMGIELKGWYVLAKEAEPSGVACGMRRRGPVGGCALGSFARRLGFAKGVCPFVMGARHAAEMRNWYWAQRPAPANPNIRLSEIKEHYPDKGRSYFGPTRRG